MLFALLGAALVLASYFLAGALLSAAVAAAAPSVIAATSELRPSPRGAILLGLRMLPPAVGFAVALGLVAPSYLAFEPFGTGEGVGLPLTLLAVGGAFVLLHGVARAARALAATATLARRWSRHGGTVSLSSSPVQAFRVEQESPVFAVVGVRQPRLFVSNRVLDALTPDEVEAAVAHERAHLAARDNLKRLLMCAAPDLLAFSPAARALESEWSRASEALADERASAGRGDTALALAAGLLKVARLTASAPPRLPISALHDGGDVEARVRRLVRAAGAEGSRSGRRGTTPAIGRATAWIAALAGVATLGAVAVAALPAVHSLMEMAVRLAR